MDRSVIQKGGTSWPCRDMAVCNFFYPRVHFVELGQYVDANI